MQIYILSIITNFLFSSDFSDVTSLFKHLCFWVFLTHIWTSHCISDNLKAIHSHNSIDICAHLCCTSSISLPLRMLGSQPYPNRILDMWGIILLLRMDLGREMSTGIYLCLSISLFFFFFASADLQFPISLPMCHSNISEN